MSVPARICTNAVGDRRRPVEARIDADELRVAVPLRLHDEAEADRVVLSRVAAHGEDDIRVADVGPAVGHRPASERGGQTGHRGAVSYPGLLLDRHDAEPGAERLHEQVVDLVGVGAAADDAERGQRVDRRGPLASFSTRCSSRVSFTQPRDAVDREVPRLLFPRACCPARGTSPSSAGGR